MIVSKIDIEKFRMLEQQSFDLGERLTAIIGQNGTMKSTLLGMIGEPFRFENLKNINGESYRTIDGKLFQLVFSDAFKFSGGPNGFERAGDHKWSAYIDKTIYEEGKYTAITIARTNKEKNDIRTWSEKGKEKGDKHVQFPVIYLSLKRLVPIGEEKRIEHNSVTLSDEEKQLFEKYHKRILLLQQDMTDTEYVKSSNKSSLGFVTEKYDSLTNSAGQDNVGKVLMAIFSFGRLKKELGTTYHGGLLLIDEIDATLYPAAQKKLIEALMKFAGDYSLQVVFTTHSEESIRVLYDPKFIYQCKTLYLETRDNETEIIENLPLKNVLAHLRTEVVYEKDLKIKVFSEDEATRIFAKNLLPKILVGKLNFIKVSLGHGEMNNLRKVGLSDFVDGILVFDGDVDVSDRRYKSKNTIALPGSLAPEQVFFKFLKELKERDIFWGKIPGSYSKQICFAGFETENGDSVEQSKLWFNRQKRHFGSNCSKLVTRWKKDNSCDVERFQNAILKAFESVGGTL